MPNANWVKRAAAGSIASAMALAIFSACNANRESRDGQPMSVAHTHGSGAVTPAAGDRGSSSARVERGRYLVTAGACSDCHTPFKMTDKGPQPDMDRYLSGHPQDFKLPPPPALNEAWVYTGSATNTAFAGPWGITYSANLTPDTHGLKPWTEEMFVTAMKTARHFGQPNARLIQPPMPVQQYGQLTDEDLKSIFAYLRTVKPISNIVPDYQPPSPHPAPTPTK